MSGLILPGQGPNASSMCGVVHRPDRFVDALVSSGDLNRVGEGIRTVVNRSMQTHPMRGGSKGIDPEWKRRMMFCVEKFREMQGDLKWTTDRALSMLGAILSAHLDGRPCPLGARQERRTLWAPDRDLAHAGAIRVDDVALAPAGPSDGVESLAEYAEQHPLDDGEE